MDNPPNRLIRIIFDREGTEIVHLWFPPNNHSLMKRMAAPYDRQKSDIPVNLEKKKGLKLCIFSLQNTKFS